MPCFILTLGLTISVKCLSHLIHPNLGGMTCSTLSRLGGASTQRCPLLIQKFMSIFRLLDKKRQTNNHITKSHDQSLLSDIASNIVFSIEVDHEKPFNPG